MTILCVDDEYLILQEIVAQCRAMPDVEEAVGFTSGYEALAWLDDHTADIALLDIDMPGMDGITLAMEIKQRKPDTAIIFLTAFAQYSLQAFSLHASGYLLKPVEPARLAEEFAYAMSVRPPRRETGLVEVKTFGGFDVFVNGEQVTFRKSKSKELLAFLVDKHGSSVTRAEAFTALWEDRVYDRPMQKQFDVIIRTLRDSLKDYGVDDIFSLKSGTLRIIPEKISCDAYRLFSGDPDAINEYHGEYMSSYPWASITEGYLTWKAFGEGKPN